MLSERNPTESAVGTSGGPVRESDATPACVSIRSLNVRFGTHTAVRSFDLDVSEQEFVALVGRSGCGKTTILNAVAGLIEPTSGEIQVFGGAPRESSDRFAYMFARDALLPWRTAQRNVELLLELRAVPRKERRARARSMLARVGLEAFATKYPRQLSQGMRQRVALARTWASEPELLLMDEPFAALDAQTATDIRAEFMAEWEARKQGVIFVTHNLREALLLADRVVVIHEGQISQEVTVPFERPRDHKEVRRQPEFDELERSLEQAL